jgi:glycosyltransferase involved in cell wall biosynthesis
MQVTIVPSEFTKSVFVETAKQSNKEILTNIQVIPEYFDNQIYDNKNITTNVSGLDEIKEASVFLTVGHWLQGQVGEDRKNISGLIHCFFNTFKNKKDAPALLLKTSGATYSVTDRIEIENKISQIRDLFPKEKLPSIYLLHGDLTNAEMNALYNHSKIKAMVSFTKAEGFGRPLLEFATTGKPIIAPHYSGQADFLKKDFICALPGQLTPIHQTSQNAFLIAEAKWFTPDYGFAGKMLQEVLKNYKTWKDLATRQRYFVNTNFTEPAVAKRYDEVLQLIDTYVDKLPKAIELKLPKLQKV